jgi:membrane protein required for colicin V production
MESLPINIVDLCVFAVLLLSGLLAFLRGFVSEVFSIAAWVGAFVAAAYGYIPATPLATELTGIDGVVAEFLAGGVIFVAAVIVLSTTVRILCGLLKLASLGAVDRSLGFLFGLLRGAVLVFLAYLMFLIFGPEPANHPSWLKQAKTAPIAAEGAQVLISALPADLQSRLDTTAGAALRSLQQDAGSLLIERMISPAPRAAPSKTDASTDDRGYTDKERQELNRIIQSTQ